MSKKNNLSFGSSVMACLAVISFFCIRINAQADSLKEPIMYFRTLGIDCAPADLHYMYGSNNMSFTVLLGMRSMPQPCDGVSPLFIFRTITTTNGMTTNIPVLSVDISHSGHFPLLLFSKGTNDIVPPRVQLLSEDSTSYPRKTIRIFNDTSISLIVSFGSSNMIVRPYSIGDHRSKTEVITVGIATDDEGGATSLMRANIGILPDSRILFLAFPSTTPGSRVVLQRHYDTVPDH